MNGYLVTSIKVLNFFYILHLTHKQPILDENFSLILLLENKILVQKV